MSKLRVILLWHMHQPFYTDLWSGVTSMPWVRLHASRSYTDMAVAIEQTPARVVVNFTPSLLVQLRRLADGAADSYLDIARKPVDSLTPEERAFVLDNFFAVPEKMIKPNPRYRGLMQKRRSEPGKPAIEIQEGFTTGELRDLITWFHLSWVGWAMREKMPELNEIQERGWDFTEEEKETVLDSASRAAWELLEKWKELGRSGKVELTTSPYAHPILPLLVDTETARRCMPDSILPEPFRYPQDARAQVALAREAHRENFGSYPVGMWPSEGSVSPEIIPILQKAGFRWMATDEGILYRSPGFGSRGDQHLSPYLARHKDSEICVFFRDRKISDLVGFDYQKMSEKEAAEDFLGRVRDISGSTSRWEASAVLTVALDGENPWEHYENGGKEFLHRIYDGLAAMSEVESILPEEWLRDHKPCAVLENIHSGSWIRSDFSVWIGDQEENDAWETLLATRRDYEEITGGRVRRVELANTGHIGFFGGILAGIPPLAAEQELYAAEGSDWFWWFGDDFTSDKDEEFDRMFRTHQTNVYRFLGQLSPERLAEPIIRPHPVKPDKEALAFICPTIDGRVTEYYEWVDGAMYTVRTVGGAMYTREVYLERIYYGFDPFRWFLRLDRREKAWSTEEVSDQQRHSTIPDCVVVDAFVKGDKPFRVEFPAYSAPDLPCRLYRPDRDHPELLSPLGRAAADKCMEIAIPFRVLDAEPGMEIQFAILLFLSGNELDRYPPAGFLRFQVPDVDFERKMWSV